MLKWLSVHTTQFIHRPVTQPGLQPTAYLVSGPAQLSALIMTLWLFLKTEQWASAMLLLGANLLNVSTTAATSGAGEGISLTAQQGAASNAGGAVSITGGTGGNAAAGGTVTINGGTAGSGGTAGAVDINNGATVGPVAVGTNNALYVTTTGNIGINNTSPDAHAILDIAATNQGVYLPRMSSTTMNTIVPTQAGMLVFASDLQCLKCLHLGTNPGWQPVYCTCNPPNAPTATAATNVTGYRLFLPPGQRLHRALCLQVIFWTFQQPAHLIPAPMLQVSKTSILVMF